MNWQKRYEELAAAVRLRSDDPALLHIVGPSEEEQRAAAARIKQLDRLSPQCLWESFLPDYRAQVARRSWARVMKLQQDFEERYC
jgi:hypothetical protein